MTTDDKTMTTVEELWIAHGHRIGAYDPTGRTLTDLLTDFHQTRHVIGRVRTGLREAADQNRPTTAYHHEMQHLTARDHLIRAAIQAHGCHFNDWADEGTRTITDPTGHVIAHY